MKTCRIRTADHVLLCSDYDGTLTPIVETPEKAVLAEETRRVLATLGRQKKISIGIVSGRALSDLRERVGATGVVYTGNHGLEIEGPGIKYVEPLARELRPVIAVLHRVLTLALSAVKGVLVEDKGLTLSVHYRQIAEGEMARVGSIFEHKVAVARLRGQVKTTSGKRVYEVRPPVEWDKGKALTFLADRLPKRKTSDGPLTIFFGDDLTDEDGFRALNRIHGVSVYVGKDNLKSCAGYYLESPDEVREFLRRLLELRMKESA